MLGRREVLRNMEVRDRWSGGTRRGKIELTGRERFHFTKLLIRPISQHLRFPRQRIKALQEFLLRRRDLSPRQNSQYAPVLFLAGVPNPPPLALVPGDSPSDGSPLCKYRGLAGLLEPRLVAILPGLPLEPPPPASFMLELNPVGLPKSFLLAMLSARARAPPEGLMMSGVAVALTPLEGCGAGGKA